MSSVLTEQYPTIEKIRAESQPKLDNDAVLLEGIHEVSKRKPLTGEQAQHFIKRLIATGQFQNFCEKEHFLGGGMV